jgi:hypothetical protein
VASTNRFALDWRRLNRWCLLGTAVMFIWLMAPVVKCSFVAFRDTPLSETQPSLSPSQTDENRVEQADGFVAKVTTAAKVCYARTPLLGQEDWKTYLMIGFAAGTLLTWGLRRWDSHRRKTFDG